MSVFHHWAFPLCFSYTGSCELLKAQGTWCSQVMETLLRIQGSVHRVPHAWFIVRSLLFAHSARVHWFPLEVRWMGFSVALGTGTVCVFLPLITLRLFFLRSSLPCSLFCIPGGPHISNLPLKVMYSTGFIFGVAVYIASDGSCLLPRELGSLLFSCKGGGRKLLA